MKTVNCKTLTEAYKPSLAPYAWQSPIPYSFKIDWLSSFRNRLISFVRIQSPAAAAPTEGEVAAVKKALAAWESGCNVRFKHVDRLGVFDRGTSFTFVDAASLGASSRPNYHTFGTHLSITVGSQVVRTSIAVAHERLTQDQRTTLHNIAASLPSIIKNQADLETTIKQPLLSEAQRLLGQSLFDKLTLSIKDLKSTQNKFNRRDLKFTGIITHEIGHALFELNTEDKHIPTEINGSRVDSHCSIMHPTTEDNEALYLAGKIGETDKALCQTLYNNQNRSTENNDDTNLHYADGLNLLLFFIFHGMLRGFSSEVVAQAERASGKKPAPFISTAAKECAFFALMYYFDLHPTAYSSYFAQTALTAISLWATKQNKNAVLIQTCYTAAFVFSVLNTLTSEDSLFFSFFLSALGSYAGYTLGRRSVELATQTAAMAKRKLFS